MVTSEESAKEKNLALVELTIKKKGKFNYSSWATVWAELKKYYPTAKYKVLTRQDVKEGMLYDTGKYVFPVSKIGGGFVKLWLSIDGEEYTESYPITNTYNSAIKYDMITNKDIDYAVRRGLVKLVAIATGLGLYLYEGEDLPNIPEEPKVTELK